jgi:hypothetical protein
VTDELGQAALGRAAADLIARLQGCTTALRPIGNEEQVQHRITRRHRRHQPKSAVLKTMASIAPE